MEIESAIEEGLKYNQAIALTIELLIEHDLEALDYKKKDKDGLKIRAKYQPIIDYTTKNSNDLRRIRTLVRSQPEIMP